MSEYLKYGGSNTRSIDNKEKNKLKGGVVGKINYNLGFSNQTYELIHNGELKLVRDDVNNSMKIVSMKLQENLEEDLVKFLKSSTIFINENEKIIKKSIERLDFEKEKLFNVHLLEKIYHEMHKIKSEISFDDAEKNRGILNDNQSTDVYLIDVKEPTTEEVNKENFRSHYQHFIAGGIAGAFSRTITAPLERLKILYQVNYRGKGFRPPSILQGLKEVYLRDGFNGLFRGNLINLLKATPDSAIKLYMFEKSKFYLKGKYGEKLSSGKLFIAGAIAGVTANVVIFPLDVIKTRLSAAPSGTYRGIFDTTRKLYKEGGFKLFYKGVEASICCVIPNSGLNLCFYELMKRAFSGSYSNNNANSLSTPTLMFCGGLSAMLSSTLLYPFQTIQSRIIMQGLPKYGNHRFLKYNSPYNYVGDHLIIEKRQNMIQVTKSTILNEGYRGFFKGYGPGISKIILGNALAFGLYENVKNNV